MKKIIVFLLSGVCLLTSCIDQYATFTDIYYIHNKTLSEIVLETNHDLVWDTCGTSNPYRVSYNSVRISPLQTIRIHPVVRSERYQSGESTPNITPLIGTQNPLIYDSDTIEWEVDYPRMFTNDSVWSIYNTQYWQTVKDSDAPYTFYHTFVITTENMERSPRK